MFLNILIKNICNCQFILDMVKNSFRLLMYDEKNDALVQRIAYKKYM